MDLERSLRLLKFKEKIKPEVIWKCYAGSFEEAKESESPLDKDSSYQPVISEDPVASLELASSSIQANHGQAIRAPSLCIAVIGATGELARLKIFPALFALYYSGFLPEERRVQLQEYSFSWYLCYLTYAPLYIAGPIISFNVFASQLDMPVFSGLVWSQMGP